METIKQGSSFWYTRLQGALFLLAFLTSGLGDALTSLWMIEGQGLMREGNLVVRYIISYYGAMNFVFIKIWFTFIILLAPFLICARDAVYWLINGYLFSFLIGGALSMLLNIQAAANQALFLMPQHVILIFISSVLILTNMGELIDKMTSPVKRGFFDCAIHDIIIVLNVINLVQRTKVKVSQS